MAKELGKQDEMRRELSIRLIDSDGKTIDELVNSHVINEGESPTEIQIKLQYQSEVERLMIYAEQQQRIRERGYNVVIQIGGPQKD